MLYLLLVTSPAQAWEAGLAAYRGIVQRGGDAMNRWDKMQEELAAREEVRRNPCSNTNRYRISKIVGGSLIAREEFTRPKAKPVMLSEVIRRLGDDIDMAAGGRIEVEAIDAVRRFAV
jgi:hypothetical protein